MSIAKAKQFKEVLKNIMESEVPDEATPSHVMDFLVMEGYVEAHGNRKFHVTESGALLYAEVFIKLINNTP